MTDRLKVLVITRNLPPLVGGMERLLHNLILGVAEYAEVTVIGPTGCRSHLPNYVQVHECSPRLARFLICSTWRGLRLARQQPWDIVIGGSGLVGPTLWLLKRLYKLRTLVLVHGLDLVADNWFYQGVFVTTLKRVDQVVANSRNTRNLAMEKGIAPERITVIHPGTHVPEMPSAERQQAFLEKFQIFFDRYILFTGRMTRRKGLSGFIRHCLPEILEACPDCGLIVVGDEPGDALDGRGERAEVLRQITELGLWNKVIFAGEVDDDDLACAFACAAVQVFPLSAVKGDVEGFGMVAVEAAAQGTGTVAFNLGGVADALPPGSGDLIDTGDYRNFTHAVCQHLQAACKAVQACVAHAGRFAWPRYHREFRALVESLVP